MLRKLRSVKNFDGIVTVTTIGKGHIRKGAEDFSFDIEPSDKG